MSAIDADVAADQPSRHAEMVGSNTSTGLDTIVDLTISSTM